MISFFTPNVSTISFDQETSNPATSELMNQLGIEMNFQTLYENWHFKMFLRN